MAASSLAVKTVYERTRLRLASDIILYVRANGDNNADGYTEATAKATLAGAFAALSGLDPGAYAVLVDIGPGRFAGKTILANPAFTPENLYIRGAGVETTYLAAELTVYEGGFSLNNMALAQLVACGGSAYIRPLPGTTEPGRFRFKSEYTTLTENHRACQARERGFIRLRDTTVQYEGRYTYLLASIFNGSLLCYGTAHNPLEGMYARFFAHAGQNGCVALYNSTFAREGWDVDHPYNLHLNGQLNVYGGTLAEIPGATARWHVSSTEALYATRGIAVAHGLCSALGTLAPRSVGVAACARISDGTYRVDLTHDLGSAQYPVIAVPDIMGTAEVRVGVLERTAASVTFRALVNGRATDASFSFAVYP